MFYKLITDKLKYINYFLQSSSTFYDSIKSELVKLDPAKSSDFNLLFISLPNIIKLINSSLIDIKPPTKSDNVSTKSVNISTKSVNVSTKSDNVVIELKEFIKIYDLLTSIEINFPNILLMVNDKNLINNLILNMSQTFIDELYYKINTINNLISEYNVLKSNDLSLIYDYIENNVNLNDAKLILDDEIDNESNEQNQLMRGGNVIIFNLLKFVTKKNDKTFLSKIELLKNNLLMSDSVSLKKNQIVPQSLSQTLSQSRSVNLIEKLVTRKNVIPVSDFMKLDDIKSKYLGNKCVNILKLNKKYKSLFSKSSLYFDHIKLINKEYLEKNDLIVNDITGLNNKVLARYKTVIDYDITSQSEDTEIMSEEKYVVGKKDVCSEDYYLVLETLDGENYRILSDNNSVFVMKDRYDMFLGKLNDRSELYNNILGKEILNNCVDNKMKNLLADYEKDKQHFAQDSATLINSIKDSFINNFDNLVNSSKVGKFSYDDFKAFIFNKDMISDVLAVNLFKNYNVDKNDSESALTFLQKVDEIIFKFNKELMSYMEDNPINTKIFAQYEEKELFVKLKFIYKDYMLAILTKMDKKPSIWKSIELSIKFYVRD